MAEVAKVIRMSGYGADSLREAIQSGMLSAEAQRACRQVLEESARLRRENGLLRERVAVLETVGRNDRRDRVEAYRAVLEKEAAYKRMWDRRMWVFAAAVGAGCVLMAAATVLVMMLV